MVALDGLSGTLENPSPTLVIAEVLGDLELAEGGAGSLEVDKEEKDLTKSCNIILTEDLSHDGVWEEDKSDEHIVKGEQEDEEGEDGQIITPPIAVQVQSIVIDDHYIQVFKN